MVDDGPDSMLGSPRLRVLCLCPACDGVWKKNERAPASVRQHSISIHLTILQRSTHVPPPARPHINPTPECLQVRSHHVVHAESPTHPLIRTEPNHQSARMTTCLPDMHATPRSTPTQITLRPARRAIRSASPTCVHSELICSTWKYCTPSRDPRHPICMPT